MSPYIAYCPSYKRADTAITHKIFRPKNFVYVVREEEADAYKKLGRELAIIPSGSVSNISQTRNWILDNSKEQHIIMLDDDMSYLNTIYKRARVHLNPDQIDTMICQMFEFSAAIDTGMWGLNLVDYPMSYAINSPFSFDKPVLGPFSGHVIDELRYDEVLYLKEDYDFFLQKIDRYGSVLRANYVNYVVDHFKLAGGCQTHRTMEDERRQQRLLQEKWGSKIVRYNELNEDSVNMRIRL